MCLDKMGKSVKCSYKKENKNTTLPLRKKKMKRRRIIKKAMLQQIKF